MNYIQQFYDAIRASGIEAPDNIQADGSLHRFSSNGNRGDNAGWYILFVDGMPAGSFGCWRTGLSNLWKADIGRKFTATEEKAHQKKLELMRQQRKDEKKRKQSEASVRAEEIWQKGQPEFGDHVYLRSKNVKPFCIRTNGESLLIPMRDSDGKLHSTQTILPNGEKRFLSGGRIQGCYHSIGTPDAELCIAEGYATAASIHEATGKAVAVAFNAGNLKPVAQSLKIKYPNLKLILCADDDYQTEGNPGISKATAVAQAVDGLLAVPDFGNDRPDGATDFNDMAIHKDLEAVRLVIERASTPPPKEYTNWSPNSLSELTDFEYAKVRLEAAAEIGVRPADLDKEVKRLRAGSNEASTTQGKAIELYEPEPWNDPVDGLSLLNAISETIKRHMSLRDADADTSAIWAAHTYLYEAFLHTPRLCITAPDAECGKTVLMSHMIGNLVTRPQIVENMSPAPFFRLAASYQPTFLIDEVDSFLKEDSDLISALNNGWEPHGCVLRCAGDDHEVFQFSTHCPVAMAGIELYNRLPPATMSRCIVIHLERAIEDEVREEYDKRKHSHGIKVLGRKLARWCQDHYEELKRLDPVLPKGVKNRLADKWRPLMAIAQVAGGNWPSRIERAMFSQLDMSDPSKRHQLLTDMMEVMDVDLHTTTLIEKLSNMADAPWSGYNFKEHDKDRRNIKPRQLANLLKGYRVHPKDVRAGGSPRKGYYYAEVKRAYDRYIGVHPSEKGDTELHCSNDVGLKGIANATGCSGYEPDALQALHNVADRNCLKANASKDCSVVAYVSGGKGQHEGTL